MNRYPPTVLTAAHPNSAGNTASGAACPLPSTFPNASRSSWFPVV